MPEINCNNMSTIHNLFSIEDDIFTIEILLQKEKEKKKKETSQPKFEIGYDRLADLKRLWLSDSIRHGGGGCEISEFCTSLSPAFDFEHQDFLCVGNGIQ